MSKEIYTCDACQELVSMVVQKAVKMAQMMNIPIVGLVENMSYVACPDCGKKRVRPADEQESKEYLDRQKHTEKWN